MRGAGLTVALVLAAAPALAAEGPAMGIRSGAFVQPVFQLGVQMPGSSHVVPTLRIDLELGGNTEKDLTLALQGGPAWVLGSEGGTGIHLDFVARRQLGEGTFLQLGAGVAPVPELGKFGDVAPATLPLGGWGYGVGGQVGAGYRARLNEDVSFGGALTWDGRFQVFDAGSPTLVNGILLHAFLELR